VDLQHRERHGGGGGDRLDLRDRLRVDRVDRLLCTATKRRLAQQHWSHVNHDADTEAGVVLMHFRNARPSAKSESRHTVPMLASLVDRTLA